MAATVQTSWGRGLVFWNRFLNSLAGELVLGEGILFGCERDSQ